MSPFQVPSLFTILAHIEYGPRRLSPMGGCNAIPRAMAQALGRMGVDVRLGEPVEEMLFEGRRATGVRTAQGTYAADAVVVNADFAHAMKSLVPTAAAALDRRQDRRQELLLLDLHALSGASRAAFPTSLTTRSS
jgi:phytoene desaturase